MSNIFRITFGVFLFSFLLSPKSNAAISSGFPVAKFSVSEKQNNSRKYRTPKYMARLENVLEGKKKNNAWKYIFWTASIVGVFVGFHFLFPELEHLS